MTFLLVISSLYSLISAQGVARAIVCGIEMYNLNVCVWPCHSFKRSPV